jgi:hypothetical protein
MKKIDRILPGKTGNKDGECRAGIGSGGLKIPVRQFYSRIIFLIKICPPVHKKKAEPFGPCLCIGVSTCW